MNQAMNQNDEAAAAATSGADAAAAAAAAQSSGDAATLLQQGAGAETAWLPEKFRVNKDGTDQIDIDASARKLAASYSELERNRGGNVPKTAAEYDLKLPETVKAEDVQADPMFKSVIDKAHAAGISNEALNFFMGEYFENIAPNLLKADVALSADEAKQQLASVWATPDEVTAGLKQAARAAQGFAGEAGKPGSFDNLMAKFGNDPDFLAFAARIGAEMGEDKPIAADPAAQQDWESQVNEVRANPAYMDKSHPQHKALVEKLAGLYQRRYGGRQQQLGGSAVR